MSIAKDFKLCDQQFILRNTISKQDRNVSGCMVTMPTGVSLLNYRGVFSKGFNHPDNLGPDGNAYQTFVEAIQSKNQSQVNATNNTFKRLIDSYCVFDFELVGLYKSTFSIPSTPDVLSAQAAAELVELYNMALARDIPFADWSTNSTIASILTNMNLVKSSLQAPLENENITVSTLFRGPTPGDLIGPLVSQFLYYPFTMGAITIDQKYVSPDSTNYLTDVNSFISSWNGAVISPTLTGPTRYLMTVRDCANYIHLDQMWQPFYVAAMILLNRNVPFGYSVPDRQGAKFINLGPIDLYEIMNQATKHAMNSAWMYKWCQLRLRPEEMGYQVHLKKTTGSGLDFPSSLLDNPALASTYNTYSTYLLPQAYREGSPAHPSYPAGHATIAGAMTTILKAFFNCSGTIPAKGPSSDGSVLVDLGYNLNIGDELDKLASNCGTFRNFAGIHYRSDMNGILLGELVAIQLLQEYVRRYSSPVKFTLKKRDQTVIEIKNY